MKSQRHPSRPRWPLICVEVSKSGGKRGRVFSTLDTPIARNPPTPDAREFAAWNTPILQALSLGLYQNEKYMMDAGTTPLSGMPRKNRAARNPGGPLTVEMHATTVPKRHMTIGKNRFPENRFISRFDGKSRSVTMKYVIETACDMSAGSLHSMTNLPN